MNSSEVIRRRLRDQVNRIRRVQRILELPEFDIAWQRATLEESNAVEAMIALNQADKIQAWLNTKCRRSLDEMTLKELRDLARANAVPYYGAMNKHTLVWELTNAIPRNNEIGNASSLTVGQSPR